MSLPEYATDPIAIVGMTGRFPRANTVAELWENLFAGVDGISDISEGDLQRWGVERASSERPEYIRRRGVLDEIAGFDAGFFGYSPREAALIDPQQRIFLECAWHALEDAGYNCKITEARIAVVGGAASNSYLQNGLRNRAAEFVSPDDELLLTLASGSDYLATRVAYKLHLRGPAFTVQTGCSTGLVAVALAADLLRTGRAELALAGAVSVFVPDRVGYRHVPGGTASSDGYCRPFDAKATGLVTSDGCGVVVLKRLSDALRDHDDIRAVIHGIAINNDGSDKLGFTAPSVRGQVDVIGEALGAAGIEPAAIRYVEAHGTATALGDVVEAEALAQVFNGMGDCVVGTIKGHVGHLNTAAGIAGLIKAALVARESRYPATLNYNTPNPRLRLDETSLRIADGAGLLEPLDERGLFVGVSSFGLGGTNAHAVLGAPPPSSRATEPDNHDAGPVVLPVSARSQSALVRSVVNLVDALRDRESLEIRDVAYTLQVGRVEHQHRCAFVVRDKDDAVAQMERWLKAPEAKEAKDGLRVAFMFPGQGTEFADSARSLLARSDLFRSEFLRAADVAASVGQPLAAVQELPVAEASADSDPGNTLTAQPGLLALQYALAALWMRLGVEPAAMIGHSLGEYSAALMSGVFDLEGAIQVTCRRAELMDARPEGAMTVVFAPEKLLAPHLPAGVVIAARNGPQNVVICGTPDAVEAAESALGLAGLRTARLASRRAFHGPMMREIVDELTAVVAASRRSPPALPLASNLTGGWLEPEVATDPSYWGRHAVSTVEFAGGVQRLREEAGVDVFLEVGAGSQLSAIVAAVVPSAACVPSLRTLRERIEFAPAVAELWTYGLKIRWERMSAPSGRRVSLPGYPFEHENHWLDAWNNSGGVQARENSLHDPRLTAVGADNERRRTVEELRSFDSSRGRLGGIPRDGFARSGCTHIEEGFMHDEVRERWTRILGEPPESDDSSFFHSGGESLHAVRLISVLKVELDLDLPFEAFLDTPTINGIVAAAAPATVGARGGRSLPDYATRDTEGLQFSLFFFSATRGEDDPDAYAMVREAAVAADARGFEAVWTPERHFHNFGSLYPNPSVLGAAIAAWTERIAIRAGSVVLPLHNPIRVAEEWAVVDNLSGGRVGISVATGFHPHDFILAPAAFESRHQVLEDHLDVVQRLWRGDHIEMSTGMGTRAQVSLHPSPITPELPVWLTAARSEATFVKAGTRGANVLTALLELQIDELASHIRAYRSARAHAGFDPETGRVTLMLHTLLGRDREAVRQRARGPFQAYLLEHTHLMASMAKARGWDYSVQSAEPAEIQAVLDLGFSKFFERESLMGTVESATKLVIRLEEIGVDEIACLVDFGCTVDEVLESIELIGEVRANMGELRRAAVPA